MRNLTALSILAIMLVITTPTFSTEDDEIDMIEIWVRERDEVIQKLLYLWLIEQKPMEELKPLARRIGEFELFIMNKCGGEIDCYKQYSVLFGRFFTPYNLPVVLMEAIYHIDLDPGPLFLGKRFYKEQPR